MWSGWAVALAEGLAARDRPIVEGPLFAMLGYDAATGAVLPGGGLAATPMARLRERTGDVLIDEGLSHAEVEQALAAAWHAPGSDRPRPAR